MLLDVELVQRTPFLLSYQVTKHDTSAAPLQETLFIQIINATLEADAAKWRERPIHKLVTTLVRDEADARRVFQGIGLIDPAHTGVMRGRLSILSSTADPWGITVFERGGRGALAVEAPTVTWTTSAIVTLEIERQR